MTIGTAGAIGVSKRTGSRQFGRCFGVAMSITFFTPTSRALVWSQRWINPRWALVRPAIVGVYHSSSESLSYSSNACFPSQLHLFRFTSLALTLFLVIFMISDFSDGAWSFLDHHHGGPVWFYVYLSSTTRTHTPARSSPVKAQEQVPVPEQEQSNCSVEHATPWKPTFGYHAKSQINSKLAICK